MLHKFKRRRKKKQIINFLEGKHFTCFPSWWESVWPNYRPMYTHCWAIGQPRQGGGANKCFMAVSKKKKKPPKQERKTNLYPHTHKSTHAIVVWHIPAKKGRFSLDVWILVCKSRMMMMMMRRRRRRTMTFPPVGFSLLCVLTPNAQRTNVCAHRHKIGQLAISLL